MNFTPQQQQHNLLSKIGYDGPTNPTLLDAFVSSNPVVASATATGTQGEIAWDANYIYVCIATNTWKRTAISTW